ncbi:hypothetical protein ACFU8Q_37890, partial [Streptomyces sp. NPDC057543]
MVFSQSSGAGTGFRELHGTADRAGTTGGSCVARDGALIARYVPEGAPAGGAGRDGPGRERPGR